MLGPHHHKKSSNLPDPLATRVQLEAMQESGTKTGATVVLQMRMQVHGRTTSC